MNSEWREVILPQQCFSPLIPLDSAAASCHTHMMHEKELRLALICYGGVSLAVYMHGITKEIWHLVRASYAHNCDQSNVPLSASAHVYTELLAHIEAKAALQLRVLPDIIAGASAGGINGIFLAQAIAQGQSLDPLTALWLEKADIEALIAPEARTSSAFYHGLATPFVKRLLKSSDMDIASQVSPEAHEEVEHKLGEFVKARWFAPPFGGVEFTQVLLDALHAMAQGPRNPRLLPQGQPLDLFVTVTDFYGHQQKLKLHSPAEISEVEHRLTLAFKDGGAGMGDIPSLVFAARATASFPGAFPPFKVDELDAALAARGEAWPERNAFLQRVFPADIQNPEDLVLIDGSVLTNAPFKPAIEALKERPARREIDRRFVYIEPNPGGATIGAGLGARSENPGFFSTILGAMSGIPREQPIVDSLHALDTRSDQIRRMRKIVDALRTETDVAIEKMFGMTFLLDHPTPERLAAWRAKAQTQAAQQAGYSYSVYVQLKRAGIIEDLCQLQARLAGQSAPEQLSQHRRAIEDALAGALPVDNRAAQNIHFFQQYDLKYRIRRLRFVARRLAEAAARSEISREAAGHVRTVVFQALAAYLDRESTGFYADLPSADSAIFVKMLAEHMALSKIDAQTDAAMAATLKACPKALRRTILLAYLGFPFFDISTLALLQGEGLDEFDPIRIDRIAPDDASTLRAGGVQATLKGVEFHNFGAFFSRAYRENDYLWGRLHGAERLIDIVVSTLEADCALSSQVILNFKLKVFKAILAEERAQLTHIAPQFAQIEREIAAQEQAIP